ncbi:MAG: SurA N-terminal domain-containing protein [Glycocaulis sp.]
MLTLIRNLARSPIAVAIIIVPVIAAFALFGINDIFTGTGNAVATVGSERVTLQDVSRTMQREMRRIYIENPRMTQQEADAAGLGDSVVSTLIAQAAISAQANELGLAATDAQIADLIQSAPAFQSLFDSRFDRAAYQEFLRQEGWSESAFERQLRGDLRRQQFIDAALSGATPPDVFASLRARFESERRTIRALLIPPSLAGDVGEATDEQLQTFIEENAPFFTIPEQRRITLVRLDPALVSPDVALDEDELRELYEMRLETGALTDPAPRTFSQWVTPDEETANALATRIAQGEAPGAAAREMGLGEAVRLENAEMVAVPDQIIAAAAFEMGTGEARAVQGRLGWRTVYVETATDPDIPAFESIADELRTELAGETAEYLVLDALANFEEARGRGATLEEAAEAAGIPVERFDFFTADGFHMSGAPLMSLLREEEILRSAFATDDGFDTELVRFGENGYFALRVDQVEPGALADLEMVREQAAAFWRISQTDERLESYISQAMELISEGATLDEAASSIAGARVEETTLTRTQTAGPFNQGLVAAAFRAALNQPFEARAGDQRTRAIAIVTDISAGSQPPGTEQRRAIVEGLQGDVIAALERGLLDTYPVRVNSVLRDAALGRSDPD